MIENVIVLSLLIIALLFSDVLEGGEVSEGKDAAIASECQKLFDDYFQWRIRDMPQFATNIGIHEYDALLNDLSQEAYDARYRKSQEFLQIAKNLEPGVTNDAEKFNLRILKYELETFLKYFHLKGFYLQISQMDNAAKEMERLFEYMLLRSYNDYDIMIQRMQKIPKQFEQIIDLMNAGVENNITFHQLSLENINSSLVKFLVDDPEQSPLYSFFRDNFPENLTESQIISLQSRAKEVLSRTVTPAYEKLVTYLLNEYVPRTDIAITSINNGDEFYKGLIEFHTGTNYTAQEIQNIGFAEVKRILGEMEKIIAALGYEGMNRLEFAKMLRADPSNFFNSSEEMVARINYIVHDLVPPKLPQIFNKIPKTELIIKEISSEYGTIAYHVDGSLDGERNGTYYINTYDPKQKFRYAFMSLSLHEGNPGHHLQGSYSNENKNFPFFRRFGDHSNYGTFPSMFPVHAQFIEGWGLYAEKLGFDMELYGDPLERYGHYSEEIWRACRLVVDTGMHALGWTRDQALDYMFNYQDSERDKLEIEIDRYITWPGQALAYKMGELKISSLRAKAEKELRDNFSLKDFHTVILDAFGPMDFVEEEVIKWIEETLTRISGTSGQE